MMSVDDSKEAVVVFREPGGRGTDEESDFSGDGVEDGCGDGDAVDPDVPRSEEAAGIAEGGAGPDVKAAFEGERAVEVDDRCAHGR